MDNREKRDCLKIASAEAVPQHQSTEVGTAFVVYYFYFLKTLFIYF